MKAKGGKALAVATDVTDCQQVKKLVDAAVQQFGRIDVMINNAGLMQQSPLDRFKLDEWDNMIDINIKGVLYGIAAALPHMERQKSGHIINVSSESKEDYYPHHTVYQSTKGGIETLSRHLAIELQPKGIRVSVVRAGPMMDEDQKMQAAPDVAAAFYQACVDCGIDLSQRPVSHFQSVMWVFRSLVDMPADMHVDMVNVMARHPSEEAFKRY